MAKDPIYRGYDLNDLTFGLLYAFHENFVLPYSHDEVVHGKGSMIGKMPGDDWQKFANLRTLYGFMYGHPGKKLLFMGSEFGQWSEWSYARSLDWHLLEYAPHRGLQQWVRDLNALYRAHPALYEVDFGPEGFEWIDAADSANAVVSFVRYDAAREERLLVVCNFTPVPRERYRIGAPCEGPWQVLLNSDDTAYGGSGYAVPRAVSTEAIETHGRADSLELTLPPLGVLILGHAGAQAAASRTARPPAATSA
jgi:1,4-alpha-glucan branching enzyme